MLGADSSSLGEGAPLRLEASLFEGRVAPVPAEELDLSQGSGSDVHVGVVPWPYDFVVPGWLPRGPEPPKRGSWDKDSGSSRRDSQCWHMGCLPSCLCRGADGGVRTSLLVLSAVRLHVHAGRSGLVAAVV